MPIFARVATMGASSAVGGFVFSNCAKSAKNAFASMATTWSRVAVFMSTAASTVPGTDV